MTSPEVNADLFLNRGNIVRMGIPPMRIEVLDDIDGVSFQDCYEGRIVTQIDDVSVDMISLKDLRKNKKASGPSR